MNQQKYSVIIVVLGIAAVLLAVFDLSIFLLIQKEEPQMPEQPTIVVNESEDPCRVDFLDFRCVAETYGHDYCDVVDVPDSEICHWEIDTYFLDNGTNSRNRSYCERIRDDEIKKACLSVINGDVEECQNVLEEHSRLFCMVQLAEIKRDTSLCDSLGKEELVQECYDYFKTFKS